MSLIKALAFALLPLSQIPAQPMQREELLWLLRRLNGERGLGFDRVSTAKLGGMFVLLILISLIAWQFLVATTPQLRR
jgi:hypothetical protein